MKGEVSAETPVNVPASVAWECFRGPELGKIVNEFLGNVIGKAELLEGDGGIGTIVKINFPPGAPGSGYMKEKFTKIEEEKRMKETEIIEGGPKELGFDVVGARFEIIEKEEGGAKSSIIKSTIFYEIEESKFEAASPHISTKPLEIIAETAAKYLVEKNN